jgi:hypothetical protein
LHATRYRIPDEPRPTGLIRYAVDPMWPLLALMLSGNGLGLAWFAFNSRALGSATAAREWVYIAASLIGCVLLALAIGWAAHNGWLEESAIKYAALGFPALKLSLGYALYVSQSRSSEIILHFGGVLRNGVVGLLVCFMFARGVLDTLDLPTLLSVAVR